MTDRQSFRVREGVEWVNGTRVPATRIVHLTETEARFDREQGRIEPARDDGPDVSSAIPVPRKGKNRGRI